MSPAGTQWVKSARLTRYFQLGGQPGDDFVDLSCNTDETAWQLRCLSLFTDGAQQLDATTWREAEVEGVRRVRERLTAMLEALPCVDDDCPGTGKCHGPMSWCDRCGEVSKVCDAQPCNSHPVRR